MEANVVIMSGSQIEDIQLTAPSGEVAIQDNDSKVRYTSSRTYSMLKLFYPETGEWTVKVKGIQGDKIKIGMIYNYNLGLRVDIDRSKLEKNESEDINARLCSGEEVIKDSALYQGLSGYVAVTKQETGETTKIDLKNDGMSLYGTFRAEDYGKYVCTVHVEGKDSSGIVRNLRSVFRKTRHR